MINPLFSIIIPVYNRQRVISRAINSCLAQTLENFEVIVVDDASQDGSADVVSSYADSRTKLVRHDHNRGVCPARNTAVSHSRGEWIVNLDSDDVLAPDCLSNIQRHIHSTPGSVQRLGFMFSLGDGLFAPDPAPEYAVLDYAGWLRFINTRNNTNLLWCTSRSTFDSVHFPDSMADEAEYGLSFAKSFDTLLVPVILGTMHFDADNRLTASQTPKNRERIVTQARACVDSATRMLRDHGVALRDFAPRYHEMILRSLIVSHFLAGQYCEGLRHIVDYIRQRNVTYVGLASISLVAVSPKAFFDLRQRRTIRNKAARPS